MLGGSRDGQQPTTLLPQLSAFANLHQHRPQMFPCPEYNLAVGSYDQQIGSPQQVNDTSRDVQAGAARALRSAAMQSDAGPLQVLKRVSSLQSGSSN